MKVKELMTSDAGFCYGVDSLTKAAVIMWQRDCGSVPVVDAESRVIGLITDRDICIAVASRDQKASEITAGELCDGRVWTVSANDDLKDVFKLMKKKQVRRLPVTDGEGRLEGIITLADIVNAAGSKKKGKSLRKRVFPLIAAINRKPPIHLVELTPDNVEASDEVYLVEESEAAVVETAEPSAPVAPNVETPAEEMGVAQNA